MHKNLVITWAIALLLAACARQPAAPGLSPEPATTTPLLPALPTTPSTPTALPTLPPPPTVVLPTQTPALPASPTLEPEPTATGTSQPVALFTADDFGLNRNLLTGELVTDTAVLQRRPIAIKVSNSPAEFTRPQAGLSQADLVFEHVTEGAITRFTAIFYGHTPPVVGPVRSARLIDLEIPAMYDAAFAFSGASSGADGVYNRLGAADFRRRLLRNIAGEGGFFRSDEEKPWEHRLYAVPAELWQRLAQRSLNTPPVLPVLMAFSSEPPTGGAPATTVTINYRDWTVVEWVYEAENGRYWRSADGETAVDANDQQPISAANVVIIYARHQQVLSICESQVGDVCQAFSTEIQIWGQGDAIILRDGQQFSGVWRRERREHMLTFYDRDGAPIPLKVGNTWFQVVPIHYANPVTIK